MKIYSRARWHARPNGPCERQDVRNVRAIYIHYSESPTPRERFADQAAAVRGIQRFHQQVRGWSDIAYSFLVTPGKSRPRVWEGRRRYYVPASQLGYNQNSLSICVVMTENDKLTWATKVQLRRLVYHLRRRVIGRNVPVYPHSHVNETSCPGNELRAFIRKYYP